MKILIRQHLAENNKKITLLLFWPGEYPWRLKSYRCKLQNLFDSDRYSGRSSSIKPSCSKTELKRCTTTKIRWNRNEDYY